MNAAVSSIEPFDLQTASEADHLAFTVFQNLILAERQPDDPPMGHEERMRSRLNIPSTVAVHIWLAREPGGRVVGSGVAQFHRGDENNAHLVGFNVTVLPEFRRRGLGRSLLARVVEVPRREGQRLMLAGTSGRVPAGEAAMERLGAARGLASHVNQLLVERVDRGLLRRWIDAAAELAASFELGFWDGPYPEDQLEAVAGLHEMMNTQPRGSLNVEDSRVTPDRLRERDRVMVARGQGRSTLYALERATGRFAGFTEVSWDPARPDLLQQGNTGVFREHQGRGLGRWLKAAMLERVLAERPEVVRVRTGNADENAPMLAINRELGFEPYSSHTEWQVETASVLEYLNEHARPDRGRRAAPGG